ncbi:MAG: hypothetical protein ACRDQ1_16120 [Sciscionella sp.]
MVGVGWCFAVDVIGITVATALFACVRRYPVAEHSTSPSLSSILEGLRYAVGRRDLLGTYREDVRVGLDSSCARGLYEDWR